MHSRGEIWLVNLNPSKKKNEMGKIRPAIVYQNDELNHNGYPTTIILPLSSVLIDDAQPIRVRIIKRENLKKDSDAVLTQIRSIDNGRLVEKIASLKSSELEMLKRNLEEILF